MRCSNDCIIFIINTICSTFHGFHRFPVCKFNGRTFCYKCFGVSAGIFSFRLFCFNFISISRSGVSINNVTVTISKEGCYLISGELEDGQIIVDAGDSDKVQLVLDNASIHCSTGSAILVRNANKVKVTLAADSENELSDGTEYQTDDDNPDAALFSKDDLVINGSGSLTVQGNYKHGIAGNDDLVITGGRLTVNSLSHALRGKDSVAILDGTFVLTSQKDGIQASNTEDSTKG